jgi:hypothetical protein
VLVEYLIPPKSTATTQGDHVLFYIDVKRGEKVWFGCYNWRSKKNSAAFQGCHQCQRGRLLACFYRKSVIFIDGENNNEYGEQENHKLRRRSEQYAEIKARKEKRKLRVRILNNRPIKKLTVLIV